MTVFFNCRNRKNIAQLFMGLILVLSFRINLPVLAETEFLSCDLAVLWVDGHITNYQCARGEITEAAKSRLLNLEKVKLVSEINNYNLSLIPNDPGFQYQESYLNKIRLPQTWDRRDVLALRPVIAVLDSGVDINNPDLKPNLWVNPWEVPGDKIDNDRNGYVDDQLGYDFVADTSDPMPKFENGWTEVAMQHGTVVAGVAAGVIDNNIGIAGIAPSVKIMPLRVLNAKGVGNTITVAKAINYAVANGADIINLSFVGPHSDPILEDAIDKAYKAGVLVVAASGNENSVGINMDKAPQYPVCDDGINGENKVIGVASVGLNDKLSSFSNYGSRCIDIAAPGEKIFSTQYQQIGSPDFKEAYGGYWFGTSVAAPLVSGTLAILKAAYPRFNPSQLRDILIASADEIDYVNPEFKGMIGRRLNIESAFKLADKVKFVKKNPLVLSPALSSKPQIQILDNSGEPINSFLAYNPNFLGGVNVAIGDVNSDGQMEIITTPKAGGGPHVRIFNQRGTVINEFMAFMESYRGGLSLAVGDVDGDKKDDIIVGTGKGAVATVRVFNGAGTLLYQFLPYDEKYTNGLTLAVGDLDGDKRVEVVIGPINTNKLPVRVVDRTGKKLFDIRFGAINKNGLSLAMGDIDGNQTDEIIIGYANEGSSLLRLYDNKGKLVRQFFAYAKSFWGGVNIAVGDVDGDGYNEVITVPGPGSNPHVRIFDGKGSLESQFFANNKNSRSGFNVAVFK